MKNLQSFLPFLNLLIIPLINFVVKLEHRLTKIETLLKINCKEKEK